MLQDHPWLQQVLGAIGMIFGFGTAGAPDLDLLLRLLGLLVGLLGAGAALAGVLESRQRRKFEERRWEDSRLTNRPTNQ